MSADGFVYRVETLTSQTFECKLHVLAQYAYLKKALPIVIGVIKA